MIFSESCYLINTMIISPDTYPSDLHVSTAFNCQVFVPLNFFATDISLNKLECLPWGQSYKDLWRKFAHSFHKLDRLRAVRKIVYNKEMVYFTKKEIYCKNVL
jgi:hypothetical protein